MSETPTFMTTAGHALYLLLLETEDGLEWLWANSRDLDYIDQEFAAGPDGMPVGPDGDPLPGELIDGPLPADVIEGEEASEDDGIDLWADLLAFAADAAEMHADGDPDTPTHIVGKTPAAFARWASALTRAGLLVTELDGGGSDVRPSRAFVAGFIGTPFVDPLRRDLESRSELMVEIGTPGKPGAGIPVNRERPPRRVAAGEELFPGVFVADLADEFAEDIAPHLSHVVIVDPLYVRGGSDYLFPVVQQALQQTFGAFDTETNSSGSEDDDEGDDDDGFYDDEDSDDDGDYDSPRSWWDG